MLTLNDLQERFSTISTLTSEYGFLIYLMSCDYDFMHIVAHDSARACGYHLVHRIPGRLCIVRTMLYSGVMLCYGSPSSSLEGRVPFIFGVMLCYGVMMCDGDTEI